MRLDGGLGDIDPAQKNIQLQANNAFPQLMTSARHKNNRDAWIIVKSTLTSGNFEAFLVSPSGISTTPVVSPSNFKGNLYPYANPGNMRISPDGTRLVYPFNDTVSFCSFNSATGMVTPLFLFYTASWFFAAVWHYMDFSEDSRYLYCSTGDWSWNSSDIYQWKVNAGNAGMNSNSFTYTPLNGDVVTCIYTSSALCTSGNPATSNGITMTVSGSPLVTFTPCFDTITRINAKPIKLKGGIPLGGTYSGPGVSNGYFYPSLAGTGTKTITYSYTNAALCSASKQLLIINYSSLILNCGQPITDIRDGKIYATVQIGAQCWMAENLNYGTMISSSSHQRDNCLSEKYCYQDLSAKCNVQGANYQWDELMRYDDTPGLQGLCPPGWHVPDEAD